MLVDVIFNLKNVEKGRLLFGLEGTKQKKDRNEPAFVSFICAYYLPEREDPERALERALGAGRVLR